MRRRSNFVRGCIAFSNNKPALVGLIFLIIIIIIAVFAPFIAPYPEDAGHVVKFKNKLLPPSLDNLLGTDGIGRDVLSRIMFGIRISLSLAVIVLGVAIPIGVLLGTCAAYFRGWIEQVIMRLTDVFSAMPSLVFALVISAILKPSLQNSILAIAFVWWRGFCRLAYGEALSIKEEDFIIVSRSLGASHFHMIFKEILPNMISPIIVKATLDAGLAILVGTAISFLGVGASPPTPELGVMVAHARHYLPSCWWSSLFPGLTIFVIVLSFNLLGDGLRDFFGIETNE
jgi:peptide/nickel transport system permease protein